MSLDQTYARIAFPPRRTVYGVRLEDYTLGHAMLIQRLDLDVYAGWGSLALAVFVCSRPWRRAVATLNDRKSRLLRQWWTWRAYILYGDEGMAAATEAMWEWIIEAWTLPEFWERQKDPDQLLDPKERNAPLLQRLRLLWSQQFQINLDAAMDLPMQRALWDSACRMESEGHIEWVDDSTLDVMGAEEARP